MSIPITDGKNLETRNIVRFCAIRPPSSLSIVHATSPKHGRRSQLIHDGSGKSFTKVELLA